MIRCAAWTCNTRIPNRDIACRQHWNALPSSFRRSYTLARNSRDPNLIRLHRDNAGDLLDTPQPAVAVPDTPALSTRDVVKILAARR